MPLGPDASPPRHSAEEGRCFLADCWLIVMIHDVGASEAAACVRELLQQFTDSQTFTDGSGAVCPILLRPYALNGAARGYRLVEPSATRQ